MGSLGTFGSFTQARLGIYAAQQGLSVTGNNISNINTVGYSRQRLEQSSIYAGSSDRYYSANDMRIGYGVQCTGVSQLRDPYLDIRYRSELSDMGAMNAKLGALQSIQAVIDEVGKGEEGFGIVEQQLNKFYNALQQLSDKTGQEDYEFQVRSAADALVKTLNAYATKLEEVGHNTEKDLEQNVTEVNKILKSIGELNSSIRKSEIHGDMALELRDQRNMLVDQLSEYMSIDVTYVREDIGAGQTVEKMIIKLGGENPDDTVKTDSTTLVDGTYVRQLECDKADNYSITLTEAKNKYGDVYNIPGEDPQVKLDDNDLHGVIQAQREFLTEAGEFTHDDVVANLDENAKSKRGLIYYQKSLDLLANQIAKAFNEANSGSYVDENGNPRPDLGTVNNVLFSNKGDGDDTTGITAKNISISSSWSKGSHIVSSFVVPNGFNKPASTDNSNIMKMIGLFTKKIDFNPSDVDADAQATPMFSGTFQEMWVKTGTVLGDDMMVTGTMLDTYETSAVNLDTQRAGVASVDLNDEAMNLMQYSKSYNAACRLMTTLDSVLDKLINGTGLT